MNVRHCAGYLTSEMHCVHNDRQIMNRNQKGQTIVFLLIVLVVLITVLLSLVSRSLQQKRSTIRSEQSSRAFTVAESVVEKALSQDLDQKIADAGGGPYTFSLDVGGVTGQGEVIKLNDFLVVVDQDDVVQIDLQDAEGDPWPEPECENCADPIFVCWNQDASLQLNFYGENTSSGEVGVHRFAVNPVTALSRSNGFAGASAGSGVCDGYVNMYQVTESEIGFGAASEEARYLRIKTWYDNADLKVANVPPQVFNIEGEAIAQTGEQRTVSADVLPAKWPPVFDFVLFDGSGNPLQK